MGSCQQIGGCYAAGLRENPEFASRGSCVGPPGILLSAGELDQWAPKGEDWMASLLGARPFRNW